MGVKRVYDESVEREVCRVRGLQVAGYEFHVTGLLLPVVCYMKQVYFASALPTLKDK